MFAEAELTIADSIAIKILQGGAILRGVGNELHLHKQNTNRCRVLSQKLQAKVHGIADHIISNDHGQLIVHGEKECMLLQYKLQDEEYSFKELSKFQITDWISSAKFLKDPNEFILLTSHSIVLRMLYHKDAHQQNLCRITAKYSCSDKSTLYCSHIHGNTLEDLVIFGGNAFGELLIWKPSTADIATQRYRECTAFNVKLLQRKAAHNGVIFSIDFNEKFNMLTTTSDDRSIRLWKRETSTSDLLDFNFNPIASGYGHVARVFQGKIIDYGGQPYALTVGEDSFACLWKANADLVFKKRLQFGAIIWNFEYDAHASTLYTIGSTGNLVVYDLEDVLKNRLYKSTTIALNELKNDEYIAKAKIFKSNMIVGITNKNRLLYTTNNSGNEFGPWHQLDIYKSFKCTVLEVHDDTYIVICGYKRLTLLKCIDGVEKFVTLFDHTIMGGLIRAFHFLSANTFLIGDDKGNCMYVGDENFQLRIPVPLPKCKEPWTTAALSIQTPAKKDFLVLSNRMGAIILFQLEIEHHNCIQLATIRQAHGPLGATMLHLEELCDEHLFIQSAGHDGSLRSYVITIDTDSIKLQQKQLVPIAWVEHLTEIENTEHLLGFNDNHFVVWSQQHDFSVQVPCGGGHRSWHYRITLDDSKRKRLLQLLFIKNRELILHSTQLHQTPANGGVPQSLRNEWHTRSCNVLKLYEQLCGDTIMISAGDDNTIKITRLMPDKELVQCAELHTHISNVRTLDVLETPHMNELLIFSGGGRAQLCVTRLNLKSFRLQELLNYTLNKNLQPQAGLKSSYRLDPETRIMSCAVVPISPDKSNVDKYYLIFLCCSDGYLRKLHINQCFEVVTEHSKYYGCCLLQIKSFADSYVLTAGTDGQLRVFDLQLVELPMRLSHHASGVNAIDLLYDSSTAIVHVITGGDDQAISYTALQLRNDNTFHVQKEFHLANAHSAQVTAVQFCYNDNRICAYSSGLDQILNMIDIDTEELKYVCNTCVADTKGLNVSKRLWSVDSMKRCFIYGCGLQIFKLRK